MTIRPYDLGRQHGLTPNHPYAPLPGYCPNDKAKYSEGFDDGVDALTLKGSRAKTKARAKTRKVYSSPMVAFSFA